MKKFLASVAVVAALSTSAVAEESGYFAGLSWGYAGNGKDISWLGLTKPGPYNLRSALRFGVYGGYTQMFSETLGARYYANIDFGGAYKSGSNSPHFEAPWNLYVNADALYNFDLGGVELGAFGGLALGYVQHKAKYKVNGSSVSSSTSGVDLGLNLGLRVNYELLGSWFSTELYTRTGLYTSAKFSRPSEEYYRNTSIIGLRTSYSF